MRYFAHSRECFRSREEYAMWRRIPRCVPLLAIVVCFYCIVGHHESGYAASFPYKRFAQLQDGDSFYTKLGKTALDRGDNHRAIRLLTTAIKKGGNAYAFRYRSQAYERLGQYDRAAEDVERYIQWLPRDPWGYTKRGTRYSIAAQHQKAYAEFSRAVKLDPSSVEAGIGLGIAFTAMERYDAAANQFQKVLDGEPDHTDALLNLGVALMLSGRITEARNILTKAMHLQEDPQWKGRIERWIASLPSSTETRGLPANRSALPEDPGTSGGGEPSSPPRLPSQPATTAE